MNTQVCVNCQNKNSVNTTNNRLVTESCGHVKCMECLLNEKTGCKACTQEAATKLGTESLETAKGLIEEKARDGEARQTDIEDSLVLQEATAVKEIVLDDVAGKAAVLNHNKILVEKPESPRSKECVPKEREKNGECDWSTKKVYKQDAPHIRVDKDAKGTSYHCMKCKRSFRARSHISYHLYCNGLKKPYQCPDCNKEFASSSHYQYHRRVHRGERPHACDVCGAAFYHASKLRRHQMLHTNEKQYACKQCGKAFGTPTALRHHGLLHSGEQPHRCGTCDRRFRDASNYKKHLLTHEDTKCLCPGRGGGRARAHQCPRCSQAFHARKDMRRHMQVHNDSKPFRCKVCDRKFRRKDNLERHIRNKHPAHSAAAASECDVTALRARAICNAAPAETKPPEEGSEKTQLEKLNPLPPISKEIIQSMCDDDNTTRQTIDNTVDKTDRAEQPAIDKSYILEANIARQSVIVAKFTDRNPIPETAYVHKIKKSMASNHRELMLPPIDTKKLFQFYKEARKTENLDIGDPRPENVQKLKTILMVDEKNMNSGEKNKKEEDKQTPMHWRRKMTLNINW